MKKRLQLYITMAGLVTVEMEEQEATSLMNALKDGSRYPDLADFGVDVDDVLNQLDIEVEDAREVDK